MIDRKKIPAIVLLVEFENEHGEPVKELIAAARKILKSLGAETNEAYGEKEQAELWRIRRRAAIAAESVQGAKKALPFIEDVVVPPASMALYLEKLYKIIQKHKFEFSVWGHAGNGNVHIQPFLDLGDKKDREKILKVADEVYNLVVKTGGALSGEHNDGLMRTPFLKKQFGEPMLKIFKEVKDIFDPQNIFNPGKKIGADLNTLKERMRKDYVIEIAGHST